MKLDTYRTISAGTNFIIADDTAQYLSAANPDSSPTYEGHASTFTISNVPCKSLAIQADNRNMSTIAVGPAWEGLHMSSGWILSADSITLDVDNLNKIQVCGSANDRVNWLAIVD